MIKDENRRLVSFMVEGGLLVVGYVKDSDDKGVLLECPAVLLSSEGGQLVLAPFIMTIISSDGDMWLNNEYIVAKVEVDKESVIGNQYESYVMDMKSKKGKIIVPQKSIVKDSGGSVIDLSRFRKGDNKLN